MSSSSISPSEVPTPAPGKFEWLVVVPDKPGTLAKRLEVRPQHFAGLSASIDSGALKTGGAIFNARPDPASTDPSTWDFAGSTLVVEAGTRDEVVDLLQGDIYAKSGVWDVDKAMIWPAKIAFRRV